MGTKQFIPIILQLMGNALQRHFNQPTFVLSILKMRWKVIF